MRTYWKVLTPLVLAGAVLAQGPITDKVKVTFPNPVVVSGTTIAAGEYMIRQLPSANNPRVLEFSSDDGMKVEVTATAFPILDNMNRKPTSVILEQHGNTYHVSKIWLAGKNYGYGLPVSTDSTAMASTDNNGLRLTASYAPAQPAPTTTETTQTTTTRTEETTTVAQATPPQQPEPAPQQTPAQTEQQTQTQAQATPPEQPAPTPTPAQTEPEPAQQPAPVQTAQNDTPDLPATASHWPLLMMAGGALTLLGLRVRK